MSASSVRNHPPHLNTDTIDEIRKLNAGREDVSIYRYDRSRLKPGIVAIGISGFPKTFIGDAIDRGLEAGVPGFEDYGIVGVSLLSPERVQALSDQDGLYSILEKSNQATSLRVVGSVIDTIDVGQTPFKLTEQIAARDTRIVTVSVTPQTYDSYFTSQGELNLSNADIQHDLRYPLATPKSFVGHIVRGIALREKRGMDGLTLISTDNMPENGNQLRTLVERFIAIGKLDEDNKPAPQADSSYAYLLPALVKYTTPSSMVDRIAPQPTGDDMNEIARIAGYLDKAGTPAEPRPQQGAWVIEKDPRLPDLERAGLALIVSDAGPYETLKLRTLNALHAVIANTGDLKGHRFIHQIMADPIFDRASLVLLKNETGPTIPDVPGIELASYQAEVLARFKNTNIQDTSERVAKDAPLATMLKSAEHQLTTDGATDLLALGVAAWIRRFGVDVNERGQSVRARNPEKERIQEAYREIKDFDPTPVFALQNIFGSIGESPRFTAQVKTYLGMLESEGVDASLSHAIAQSKAWAVRLEGGARPSGTVRHDPIGPTHSLGDSNSA